MWCIPFCIVVAKMLLAILRPMFHIFAMLQGLLCVTMGAVELCDCNTLSAMTGSVAIRLMDDIKVNG